MFSEFSSCSFFSYSAGVISRCKVTYFPAIIQSSFMGILVSRPVGENCPSMKSPHRNPPHYSSAKVRKISFSKASSSGNIHKSLRLIPMIRYSALFLAQGLRAFFAHSLLTKRLYDLQIWMFLSIFASEIGHENVWAPRRVEYEAGCRRVQAHAASGTTI